MKYFSLLFFITFAISCSNDASKQDEESLKEKLSPSLVENPRSLNTDTTLLLEMGNLVFKDTIHNFGKMQEGEVVTYEFEFENKGKKDIKETFVNKKIALNFANRHKQDVKIIAPKSKEVIYIATSSS